MVVQLRPEEVFLIASSARVGLLFVVMLKHMMKEGLWKGENQSAQITLEFRAAHKRVFDQMTLKFSW